MVNPMPNGLVKQYSVAQAITLQTHPASQLADFFLTVSIIIYSRMF